MSEIKLRHARRADLPEIADVWVDAFATDPFFRWIQPDDREWPAFGTAWMTFIAELVFERGHTYVADGVAVAWIAPDVEFVGPDDVTRGRAIITAHAGEGRSDDAFATIMTARGHGLDEPHWTLQYIGIRAALQGCGLGQHVVAPMLAVCDDELLPCWLISSNPRNVSFYERHGFVVDAVVPTPDGSASMRPMHRTPQPSSRQR